MVELTENQESHQKQVAPANRTPNAEHSHFCTGTKYECTQYSQRRTSRMNENNENHRFVDIRIGYDSYEIECSDVKAILLEVLHMGVVLTYHTNE